MTLSEGLLPHHWRPIVCGGGLFATAFATLRGLHGNRQRLALFATDLWLAISPALYSCLGTHSGSDVEPQLISESPVNSRHVIFHIHFVPDFIPGFNYSYGLLPSYPRRLLMPQIIFDPLPPVTVRLSPHRFAIAQTVSALA
jgi:hypothetical protein